MTVFLDHAHAHGHFAQQVGAGTFLLFQHLPKGFLVEVTHVDHDRAESSSHLSSREKASDELITSTRSIFSI
jgi:hypothetical protein